MIPSTDVCSSALKYVGKINNTNHLTSSQCLSMKSLYVFNKGRHSVHLGNSQQCNNLIRTEGLVLSLPPSLPHFLLSICQENDIGGSVTDLCCQCSYLLVENYN